MYIYTYYKLLKYKFKPLIKHNLIVYKIMIIGGLLMLILTQVYSK